LEGIRVETTCLCVYLLHLLLLLHNIAERVGDGEPIERVGDRELIGIIIIAVRVRFYQTCMAAMGDKKNMGTIGGVLPRDTSFELGFWWNRNLVSTTVLGDHRVNYPSNRRCSK
jgi:hypothetical protein